MAKRDDAGKLKQIPRFADLSDKELKQVAEMGTFLHLPANWSLMSETTPADKAYVLLSGEVAIRQQGETVATVGPGNVIGEVGILEKRLRTAGVVSLSELDVVHFTREDFARLVDDVPAFGEAMRATAREHLDSPE